MAIGPRRTSYPPGGPPGTPIMSLAASHESFAVLRFHRAAQNQVELELKVDVVDLIARGQDIH